MKANDMPTCTCALCGNPRKWDWEHAFFKNGFDNGTNSQTHRVVETLTDNNYEVTTNEYYENPIITDIKTADGISLINPHEGFAEVDPRTFLDGDIIKLLDTKLTDDDGHWLDTFAIRSTSDDTYLHIEVADKGVVTVKHEEEGIIVDIYSVRGDEEPVASTWAHDHDLFEEDADADQPIDTGRRILAEFTPQAWLHDVAMAVDPARDTVFDVTSYIVAMGEEQARALTDDDLATDNLRHLPTAPAWIRNWSGPFYIEVQESIAAYFDQLADETAKVAQNDPHDQTNRS
jgi:hypothetical protein